MNKNIFYAIVGLILSSALFSSCNEKHKGGRTDTYSSGAIKFASDESFGSIIDEEKQIFESVYPRAKVTPIYTNEVDGMIPQTHFPSLALYPVTGAKNF